MAAALTEVMVLAINSQQSRTLGEILTVLACERLVTFTRSEQHNPNSQAVKDNTNQ